MPPEHRRDLRGLFVSCVWLNHTDSKGLNTLDTLIEAGAARYIRHHLIDFGATPGSDSFAAKSPRPGNEYLFSWRPALLQIFTVGLWVPSWALIEYPSIPLVGRFEGERFDPERWKPNYPNPAFRNRLPDDEFWAARQVMVYTDDHIRALVVTGQDSDPCAVEWITEVLAARRDRIGETYFNKVLPLDRGEIRGGRLVFEDLAVTYGFASPRAYVVEWARFDNQAERKIPLAGRIGPALPPELHWATPGQYFAADIRAGDPNKSVTVYLRVERGGAKVVGAERTW